MLTYFFFLCFDAKPKKVKENSSISKKISEKRFFTFDIFGMDLKYFSSPFNPSFYGFFFHIIFYENTFGTNFIHSSLSTLLTRTFIF